MEFNIVLRDAENQQALICALTGIEDKTKALEYFLEQTHLYFLDSQLALDGLVRNSNFKIVEVNEKKEN